MKAVNPTRTYCYHDGTDDQLLASIEADLRAGAAKFYFLYLAELDYFLHLHADDRAAAAATLQKYSDRDRAPVPDRGRDLRRGGYSRLRRSRDGADRGDDRYPGQARGAAD